MFLQPPIDRLSWNPPSHAKAASSLKATAGLFALGVVHSGEEPDPASAAFPTPIFLATAYRFPSAEEATLIWLLEEAPPGVLR